MSNLLQPRRRPALDALNQIVRVYTRAFVSQSVGIIGLIWCLFDRHPGVGVVLTALVLIDQAVFLRARFSAENRAFPFQAALNVWCLGISIADLLLLSATLFQTTGLRFASASGAVGDPLDFLAFAIATFFRLGADLAPVNASGRLLVDLTSFVGTAVLVAGASMLLRGALRHALARRPDGRLDG